jgi:glycosyltransferase involved in cell wall biosynthesis
MMPGKNYLNEGATGGAFAGFQSAPASEPASAAPTKVTQVLYSGLGGHGSVALSLIGADTEQAWTSRLLFVGVEKVAEGYVKRCNDLNVPHDDVLTIPSRPWRGWGKVYQALQKSSPDVIILHSTTSLPPVALYSLCHGTRLITVEHTPAPLKSTAEKVMSRLAAICSKRVVTLSAGYREHLLAGSIFHRLRQNKIVVAPNGIDVDMFAPTETQGSRATLRIGMAARFSDAKRQELLIEALEQLTLGRPEINWELTLAGDGEKLGGLRLRAQQGCASNRIHFAGYLEEGQLVAWFRTLDLYAQASDGEALSTAMLQAMAMGLPIVGSPVEGITDLLTNEQVVGVVAQTNTAEAFAAAIFELAASSERQAELGRGARALVCRRFSQKTMFAAYEALIEES